MTKEQIQKYFIDLPDQSDIDTLPSAADQHTPRTAQKSSRHEHIGIYNIRNRLTYLFGEAFQIHAENIPEGSGFMIQIKIPVHPTDLTDNAQCGKPLT